MIRMTNRLYTGDQVAEKIEAATHEGYAIGFRAGIEAAAQRCELAGNAAFGVHPAFEDACDACAEAIRKLGEAK